MKVSFVRPRVADLYFSVFTRTLHPELFEVLATRRVSRGHRQLTVHITPSGHALTWICGSAQVTETITTTQLELPDFGRKIHSRLGDERRGRCTLEHGPRYQFSAHVEVLPPEVFLHHHEELRQEGESKGILYHFCTHNRLVLSPLGVVIAEALPEALSITAFHTFPDECAILKTQSLIEE